MRLTRYEDPFAFGQRAVPFLLRDEATHCLLLGIMDLMQHTSTLDPEEQTDRDLMATVDDDGGDVAAVALRTPPHNMVLSLVREGVSGDAALDAMARGVRAVYGDTLTGVIGPAQVSRVFAERWSALTGANQRAVRQERIYRLERVRPPSGVPGRLRPATAADRELLEEWVAAFQDEALGDDEVHADASEWVEGALSGRNGRTVYLWVVDDDEPVCLVGHAGPTPHGMRVGPVYTPRALRGHGYASAATAAVSQLLLDSGRQFVFLFTDVANPTSNKIYRQIGYEPVCDVDVYRFTAPD